MGYSRQFNRALATWFVLPALILASLSATVGAQDDPASVLPADTFFYLVIPEGGFQQASRG